MDDHERDLADSADELAETLESLRTELREPPRGPLGLPRPPTPREFLRFTERYTIPATISLLEAAIRTLELLAAAIRVADGRPLEGDSSGRRSEAAPGTDRIATASRRTLAALDDALADLQSAAAGGEPSNPEVQRLLSEARDLRAEVDDRLAAATADDRTTAGDRTTDRDAEPVDIEVELGEDESEGAGADDATGEHGGEVDVDRELESIKREFDESTDDDGPAAGEEADHGDAEREDRSRNGGGNDDAADGSGVDDSDFGGDDTP